MSLLMRQGPETDIGDFLPSDIGAKELILRELGLTQQAVGVGSPVQGRAREDVLPAVPSGSGPTVNLVAGATDFTLAQWDVEHAGSKLASPMQCERTANFLQNAIVEKVRERNMQAFFIQKDILSRHPKLSKWPVFVQEFLAGPMCGLIAMAELHKTTPDFDIGRINKIVDHLIWSTRLSTVGFGKPRLIGGLSKLRDGVEHCCHQLGITNGTGYIEEFNQKLMALHLDLIDASTKLIEYSARNRSGIQNLYRDLSAHIDSRHPCTVRNALGHPQPYIWPAVWLTPAESVIDAAVQLRMQAQENAYISQQNQTDAGTSDANSDPSSQLQDPVTQFPYMQKPQQSIKQSPDEPSPTSVSMGQKIRRMFWPRAGGNTSIGETDEQQSVCFPMSIQAIDNDSLPESMPEQTSDKEEGIDLMRAFEFSEGKRYFYIQKKDGTGWDQVKLTWSNGEQNKPASMFAMVTRDGAMLTMSRRHLSAVVAKKALRELPAGMGG